MNKGSGIHTLGRGNLGNINARYPLPKPTTSSKSSSVKSDEDADVSDGCQAAVTDAPTLNDNAEEGISENTTPPISAGDKNDSIQALISKFERKESAQTTTTQRKVDEAVVAAVVPGGGGALYSNRVANSMDNYIDTSTDTNLEGETNKKAAVVAEALEVDGNRPISNTTNVENIITPTVLNDDATKGKTTTVTKTPSKVKIPSFLKSKAKTKPIPPPQPMNTQAEIIIAPPSDPTSNNTATPQPNKTHSTTPSLVSDNDNQAPDIIGEGVRDNSDRDRDTNNANDSTTIALSTSAGEVTSDSQSEENNGVGKKTKKLNDLITKFERKDETSTILPPKEEQNGSENSQGVTIELGNEDSNPPKTSDGKDINTPPSPMVGAKEGKITAVSKSPSRVKIPSFLKSRWKSETQVTSETRQIETAPPEVNSSSLESSGDMAVSGNIDNDQVYNAEDSTADHPTTDDGMMSDHEGSKRCISKTNSLNALISKFERQGEQQHLSSTTDLQQQEKEKVEESGDDAFTNPLPQSTNPPSGDGKSIAIGNDAAEISSSIQSSENAARQENKPSNQVAENSFSSLVSKFERKGETQKLTTPQQEANSIERDRGGAPDSTDDDGPPSLRPTSHETECLMSTRKPSITANEASVTKSSFSIKIPSFLKARSKSEPAAPTNRLKPLPSNVAKDVLSHNSKDPESDENKHGTNVDKNEGTDSQSKSPALTCRVRTGMAASGGEVNSFVPLTQSSADPPTQTLPSTSKKSTSLLVSRSKSEPLAPVSRHGTVNSKHHPHQTDPKHSNESKATMKKTSFTKQPPSKQSNAKLNPQPSSRVHHKSKSQAARPSPIAKTKKNASKPPDLNLHAVSHKSYNASASPKYNMVSPKSHQRLVLEQVASQYFLNNPKLGDARYIGVTGYAAGESLGNGGLGNIDENIDYVPHSNLMGKVANKARDELISFLDGTTRRADDDMSTSLDATNLSMSTNEQTPETNKCDGELSNDIMRETNIDIIFELASDHLSLGRNDLALQAYCRAMKIAFADVLSVKKKLAKLKHEQGDSSPSELIKQQEQILGSSLLQVASRVADVHNNMGVVYEMNCQFEAAKASYVDALDVYNNTCKRIDERGDPDVDRTKENIVRMEMACSSEKQRKELHEKSTCIANELDHERNSAKRKSLLIEAIETLNTALDLETSTVGSTHPVTASTLIQLGKYHYEMRDFDLAVMEIGRAIKILRTSLGEIHPQVGKSMLLLASIYERHGVQVSPHCTAKDDLELELYVDALGPLKATLGEVNTEIGRVYEKIGLLYGKKGDMNLSLLAFKASLNAYGEPNMTTIEGVQLEVVSIWVRVTEISTSLKAWDDVLVSGHRSLFLLRCLKNTLFPTAQIASKSTVGSVAHANRKAISDIRITSDRYYETLFNTLQSIGQAHTSLTNFTLAREACSESLQLAWEMALSNHETIAVLRVIQALKRLGKALLLDKQYTLALQSFLPCLELLRSNKETESSLDCASVLGSIGYLYLKLSKFTESSNFLRQCLRLHQDHGK